MRPSGIMSMHHQHPESWIIPNRVVKRLFRWLPGPSVPARILAPLPSMLAKNRRILVRALAARLGFGSANRLRGQVEASGASVQPITASAFGRFALIRSHLHDIRSCQLTGSRAGDETSSRLEKLAPLIAVKYLACS